MCVLVIVCSGRAVCQCAVEFDAISVTRVAIEPLRHTGDVRKRCAILAVGIKLRPVGNNQALTRADHALIG